VVIVGAGFGGLAAARRLDKQHVDVTLIDRHNYHTFLPLLYQVSTAGLNAADVGYPVRGVFRKRRRVLFRQGRVTGIDWQGQQVRIEGADPVSFDKLILAAGSATNYFGVPGAKEHSFPLYTLPDALRVRNHLLSLFEAADTRPDLVADRVLNFVVVGGGATGVEVSGAIVELIEKVLRRDFHDLDVSAARVILVERSDTLLGPFSQKSRDYALAQLRKKGVDVRLGTTVAEVAEDCVRFADGGSVPTRMVVWAAGIQADRLAGVGGWGQGPGGRITVGPDLAVEGHPDVFAIGDIADIDNGAGGRLPQLAQVALQGGKFAAKQILRDLAGEPRQVFRYRDKGTMATIGRRAAVAELAGGAKLKGFIAWLAWLMLHLVYLVGMRNRMSVLVNWGWNYLTWDRGPRLIVAAEPMPSRPQLTAGTPQERAIGAGPEQAASTATAAGDEATEP
jgi:NADH dehydrogenase